MRSLAKEKTSPTGRALVGGKAAEMTTNLATIISLDDDVIQPLFLEDKETQILISHMTRTLSYASQSFVSISFGILFILNLGGLMFNAWWVALSLSAPRTVWLAIRHVILFCGTVYSMLLAYESTQVQLKAEREFRDLNEIHYELTTQQLWGDATAVEKWVKIISQCNVTKQAATTASAQNFKWRNDLIIFYLFLFAVVCTESTLFGGWIVQTIGICIALALICAFGLRYYYRKKKLRLDESAVVLRLRANVDWDRITARRGLLNAERGGVGFGGTKLGNGSNLVAGDLDHSRNNEN
jgi:hypothetical protein